MIKEAYCSYEVSKLLKEKGFDWECVTVYDLDLQYVQNLGIISSNKNRHLVSAPTHQMAMAWLREQGIYINIFIDDDSDDPWTYNIFVRKDRKMTCAYHHHGRYFPLDGYDTALEEALKYSLENLIYP